MTDPWRARALRYTLIYLLLGVALVGLRFQTRDIRPDLLTLNERRDLLTQKKEFLELEVQHLTSGARVREWALARGMTPFSLARSRESAPFSALPAPSALPKKRPLEVLTRWK